MEFVLLVGGQDSHGRSPPPLGCTSNVSALLVAGADAVATAPPSKPPRVIEDPPPIATASPGPGGLSGATTGGGGILDADADAVGDLFVGAVIANHGGRLLSPNRGQLRLDLHRRGERLVVQDLQFD
jgi:hypothetical protein